MKSIADALRTVTAKMQVAIVAGERSQRIEADDVIEVLLAVADEIEPELGNRVAPADACPACGERLADKLVWQDDDAVHCGTCGADYQPGK